jgi:hypothetical protein
MKTFLRGTGDCNPVPEQEYDDQQSRRNGIKPFSHHSGGILHVINSIIGIEAKSKKLDSQSVTNVQRKLRFFISEMGNLRPSYPLKSSFDASPFWEW